jgi:YD repeat-containing protein
VIWENLTIELMGDGSGVYLARVKEGTITRSVQADEAVTLDYDAQGNLLGVEVLARPYVQKIPPVGPPCPHGRESWRSCPHCLGI